MQNAVEKLVFDVSEHAKTVQLQNPTGIHEAALNVTPSEIGNLPSFGSGEYHVVFGRMDPFLE